MTMNREEEGRIPSRGALRRLKEFSGPSSTDWIIAIFTVVLGVVAVLQGILLWSQLNYQKKDERPWMQARLKPGQVTLTENKPLVLPIELRNIGKTPARDINAVIFVEVVDADKGPSLIDPEKPIPPGRSFNQASTGIMFHEDEPFEVQATRRLKNRTTGQFEDWALSAEEMQALQTGKSYLATYVITYYLDTLGNKHWTAYCGWQSFHPGDYQSRSCVSYNKVDDNT